MAACCSRFVPQNAAVLKCSRPRTSDTAIWASRIVAGPYFSALLPRACHFLTFCCTTAWKTSVGFASWPLGGRFPPLQLESLKLLMYQRITGLHFHDSLQVILAARFIWRWHSNNTTTLRFQWKTCDLFFVQNDFAHLCDFVTKFGYAVWSAWKYYSMCGI